MIDLTLGAKYSEPDIGVYSGFHIKKQLIEDCYNNIDKIVYPSSATTVDKFLEWVFCHPDFCYVFVDVKTKSPVGYFYLFPLKEETCKKILTAKMNHSELTLNDFTSMKDKGLHNLYISSAVLPKQYQNGNMARMIFDLILWTTIEKAKNSVYLNSIFTDVANDFEKSVVSLFGAKKVAVSKKGRDIYGADFDVEYFRKLGAYPVLEFAYSCDHAQEFLKNKKSIFD